jgi:hypothetical protein
MKYLMPQNNLAKLISYSNIGDTFKRYLAYMELIRERIPSEIYEFVVNDWHYYPSHHRSLHDSWIDRLEIREVSYDQNLQNRIIGISLSLLGSYQDGKTYLEYSDVKKYELQMKMLSNKGNKAHGDLLVDEISLSDSGNLVHEILFHDNTTLLIECTNIVYSTDIPNKMD